MSLALASDPDKPMRHADHVLLEWHHATMADGPPANPSGVPGVYVLAIAKRPGEPTRQATVTPFYVGQTSSGLRSRWSDHLREWFTNPGANWTIPTNAQGFLSDPVPAINQGDLAREQPNREATMAALCRRTSFCYAECDDPRLGQNETMLQEAIKSAWEITVQGEIGDSGHRVIPQPGLCVQNVLPDDLPGLVPASIRWVGVCLDDT